jgi:isoleucyl-tRNA synthetase
VLVFTAEEAWLARFPDGDSVHLQDWPVLPAAWRDEALAGKWERVRGIRRYVTGALERMRAEGLIGSSLQAAPTIVLPQRDAKLLSADDWATICICSDLQIEVGTEDVPAEQVEVIVQLAAAPGQKCDRCWRVLPEVGQSHAHPTLCRRCEAVVEGLTT